MGTGHPQENDWRDLCTGVAQVLKIDLVGTLALGL
jgi:hypothetical protein